MDWLPGLITLKDYNGNFASYIDAVYRIFRCDFILNQPVFRGKPCCCDARPDSDGRECGFWHIVTSGDVESERRPDLRRCERVAWPRAIIEAAHMPLVRVWESERKRQGKGRQNRVNLAPSDFSYLVVLKSTKTTFVLITAFFLEHDHQRRKKQRECEDFESAQNS